MSKPRAKSRLQGNFGKQRNRSSQAKKSGTRRGATKHDQVLALLRAKRGATISALAKATGWQPHSVRGFLAGVVKRKLGLSLVSEKTDAGRIYRIVDPRSASSCADANAELPYA
jgi:hypothetical protein